jgi:L-amino acid N-acyltransferase YncA
MVLAKEEPDVLDLTVEAVGKAEELVRATRGTIDHSMNVCRSRQRMGFGSYFCRALAIAHHKGN